MAAFGTAAIAATLAGCGGGGSVAGSHALPQPQPGTSGPQNPGSALRQPVTVKMRIPAGRASGLHARNPKYVSSASAGIALSVVPSGSQLPPMSSPQFASAIGAPYCVAQPDFSQVCSFPMAAPVGSDTFDVALYDQAPTSSGVPQGNLLSHAISTQNVALNTNNTFTLTLGGTVAALRFTNGRWVASGSSAQFVVNVAAFDAAGELIVGSEDYDQNVLVTATSTGSADGKNHINVTTGATLTGPKDGTIVVSWDGTPFTAASITFSAGGQSGSAPFALPLPGSIAQIPVTIPAQSRGDVVLGFNTIGDGAPAGFVVVPASATSDNEAVNGGFLLQSVSNIETGDGGPLELAVLPDTTVASAYEAYVRIPAQYAYQDAVEVDLTAPFGGGSLNGFSTPFFTDLCQVSAATGDTQGNIVLVGDSGTACGVINGNAAAVLTTSSAGRHSLAQRSSQANAGRRASGHARHVLSGLPANAVYKIEVIPYATAQANPLVSVAAAQTIIDPNLVGATAIAADGVGRYYVADSAGFIDVYQPSASSGEIARIAVTGSSGTSPDAIAVDGLGRIAVLFSGEGTPTVQIYGAYPTTSSSLLTIQPPGAGPIVFDRYNNLWVSGGGMLSAYPPLPTTILPGFMPSVGATVNLTSYPTSIGAFPSAMNQSAPVQPTPSPSPTASPSPAPSGSP